MKKRNLFIVVITLMLTVVTGFFVSQAYARYVFKTNGVAEATAAAWKISVGDGTNTFNNDFTLSKTRAASDYVVADKIAPGTSGAFDIVIDPTGTEVAFDYSVKVSAPSNVTIPTGLKFYLGEVSDDNLLTLDTAKTKLVKLPNKQAFTASDKISTKISWVWEDLNTDEANAKDSEFESEIVSFPVEITVVQAIEP